jgi:hypothetical protein
MHSVHSLFEGATTMSERREQRRIERTAGTGTVSRDGVQLGTLSYLLEIWQTFHIIRCFGPGPDEEVAGLKDIRLRILRHDLDTFKLRQDRATLNLRLEDGRRLEGFVSDNEFVASGQLTAA